MLNKEFSMGKTLYISNNINLYKVRMRRAMLKLSNLRLKSYQWLWEQMRFELMDKQNLLMNSLPLTLQEHRQ